MKNILVLIDFTDAQKKRLEQAFPGQPFLYSPDRDASDEQLAAAEILLGNPPPERLKLAKNLKFIQFQSSGRDAYPDDLIPNGCAVATAAGAYGVTVSEHMLTLTLALCRKLYLYRDRQKRAEWANGEAVKSVWGSNVVIVGLGDIGGQYAKKIRALGGYTIGVKRTPGEKPDFLDELYTIDRLDEVLPRADITALIVPSTRSTYHLMDAHRLALMKPDALLINCGRGTAVDQEALRVALESGRLGAAALDVTDPEPLPPESPLWRLENLIITPHIAGGATLPKTLDFILDICIENLKARLDG